MAKSRINIAVLGGSGYTGGELLRLLAQHPYVKVKIVTGDKAVGLPVSSHFPNLETFCSLVFQPMDLPKVTQSADLVFMALPHTKSIEPVAHCIKAKKRVIDLSADYRLCEQKTYEKWYGVSHSSPHLLRQSVYGMPELHRTKISRTKLVAVPGCYPTAAILQLAPLLSKRILKPDSIVIDAKSGISGAGRSPALPYHFPEAHDSMTAYKIGQHRHTPEIEQELNNVYGKTSVRAKGRAKPLTVMFTPHLTPMNRGILSTAYGKMTKPITTKALQDLYRRFYRNERFIRIREESTQVSPNQVRGSNFCDIAILADSRTGNIITVAAIDNLVKGAAGQAIQSMNLMMGYPEDTGLTSPGIFP
ncbi:N-acetyl-gamma-glutamyl-phosphate reductase [Candidatus Nitronereus thalassa]|uniref:N-acetyl-gamma-glutamyl-phosphate reductase n=1 Tax=Candidatus Nitronereus thalassa TaxID=3020898 RepID=A0ABU3K6C4_9BACT|nr:N-acetyl-gamma-glutamyl-phosphate reductase [Candidatus Nitronereus thalassa]MDT7041957.1 N-acetyl-gamma-glutamyl-phosphate reductase [Candidatus Nitronereus thalassa]